MIKYNYINTNKTWLMRQAGRYLPEYLEERSKTPNFLEFCYNTESVVKVTKQPLERFNLDFGIIFSDILVILDVLGADVTFEKNEGPKVENPEKIINNSLNTAKLKKIYEGIEILTSEINVPLIGFIGGPFTVACYLTSGNKRNDFENTKKLIYKNYEKFNEYIEIITENSLIHIKEQIKAGCRIIKIFDSWAGILPNDLYQEFIIKPNKRIVDQVRSYNNQIDIICFPRGSGEKYIDFSNKVKPDFLALDQLVNLDFIINNVSENIGLQGNLDPILLTTESDHLETDVMNIINKMKNRKFIFNTGHGVVPETKINRIEYLLKILRKNQ